MCKNHAFLIALGLLPSLLCAIRADADANTYRYDTGHTGYTANTLTPPLGLLWRHTTEPAVGSSASPVTAGGIVYFAAGAHVYAVNATDGATIWQYPAATDTSQVFNSTPSISDGAVFIGSDGGILYKLDAKTGKVLASQQAGGAVRGAPTIEDGVVYFGSSNSHCYAASTDNLGILWDFATGGTVLTSPCIAGDDVIYTASDDSVTCLAKTSGRKQWALDFEGDPTTSPPVYADGTLYVAAGEVLYAIDAHDGATRWKQSLSGTATASPTVWTDDIGVPTLDGSMSVYSRTGRLRWRDSLGTPSVVPALYAGGLMLVPTQHGVIYTLQADTGQLAWEYVTPASIAKKLPAPASAEVTGAPLLDDQTLYVLSDDGTLSALRADALATLPPSVTALTPTPGSTVAATGITPSATVIAYGCGLNPSTVTLSLDGQPLEGVTYSASQSKAAPIAPLDKLGNGAHELVLKATDWRGNTVTQSWGFFADDSLDPQPAVAR